MSFVRHGLPLAICVVGIVACIVYPDRIEAAILIVSAGLEVWMLNWLFRVGVAGDEERAEEDRARDFFDEHGHWPDEPPGGRG